MRLLDLVSIASLPVLKVLLLTALGSLLALEHVDVLGENARKQLNQVIFFVFNPALAGSNLAKTITSESILLLWLMPFNTHCTFIIGSALGWVLIKITGASQHLKGIILGCCAGAIPTVTRIVGGNLLRGLKRSGIRLLVILGILAVRYVFLPSMGIVFVKGAVQFGLVHSDPLYQFILLLQFALPPAMSIGTITQLFGAGESGSSVIMLWTYGLASVSLTLWSTLFMWLVA